MKSQPRRLPIPNAAGADPKASEILSVWVAAGNQHVSLNPHIWDDPAAWGLLLVDLARHVANAHEQSGVMDSAAALERIRQGFDAEWGSPTDAPTGGLV
jgi:hypothetical protein